VWSRRGRAAPLCGVLLVAATACGGCVGGPSQPANGRKETVPLQVVKNGDRTLALVPITIKGHGPFRFALDTGASSSAVDRGLAHQLRLQNTGDTIDLSGVTGSATVSVVLVRHWKVGDVGLPTQRLAALDLGPARNGQHLDGLLGSDVLNDYASVTVDYDDETLTLRPH
jgi:aspartyl protease